MHRDVLIMEQAQRTKSEPGFWGGMPNRIRVRFVLGLVFLAVDVAILSIWPILGITLLMMPLLWSVLITWLGSENGRGYGPYSAPRETALSYTLQYLWQTSLLMRWVLSIVMMAMLVGGLGWISTEKMRAEVAEPALTERAVSAVDRATDATKETARDWMSAAKGWFTTDDAEN